MCLEEKIVFESFESEKNNYKELKDLIIQRILLESRMYDLLYPDDNFVTPVFIVTANLRDSALNFYNKYNYSDNYITDVTKRAHWDTTIGLTLYGGSLSDVYIFINIQYFLTDNNFFTILHELTHVNDYYLFCQKNNLFSEKYESFIKSTFFPKLYFLSEFRAHYRCFSRISIEDLNKLFKVQCQTFSQCQQEAIESQQLEVFNYIVARFLGISCNYIEKCMTPFQQNNILLSEKDDYIADFHKLLYPLRNASFIEIQKHLPELSFIMNKMIQN